MSLTEGLFDLMGLGSYWSIECRDGGYHVADFGGWFVPATYETRDDAMEYCIEYEIDNAVYGHIYLGMTKDEWRTMWKEHEQLRERIKAAMDSGCEPFVGLAEAVEIGDDQLIEHSVDLIEQSLSRHQV